MSTLASNPTLATFAVTPSNTTTVSYGWGQGGWGLTGWGGGQTSGGAAGEFTSTPTLAVFA